MISILVLVLALGIGLLSAVVVDTGPWVMVVALALGLVLMQAPRVARQWERAVVLRLGRFTGLQGPGFF